MLFPSLILCAALAAVAFILATALAESSRPRVRPLVAFETPRKLVRRSRAISLGAALMLGLAACSESAPNENGEAANSEARSDQGNTANTVGGADANPEANGKPVHISAQDEFDGVTAKGRVLVDFYADWCGPCKRLAPVLKEIAKERHPSLTVAKVDVDDMRELAREHGVRGIPYLVLFQNGKQIANVTGYRDKKQLLEWLDKTQSE